MTSVIGASGAVLAEAGDHAGEMTGVAVAVGAVAPNGLTVSAVERFVQALVIDGEFLALTVLTSWAGTLWTIATTNTTAMMMAMTTLQGFHHVVSVVSSGESTH
jgi:hypothetical protein